VTTFEAQTGYRRWRTGDYARISGTSFHDVIITATYAELVAVFGEPEGPSGDGKVQAEWIFVDPAGDVVTVYDWKEYDTPVDRVTEWHVGGHGVDPESQFAVLVSAYIYDRDDDVDVDDEEAAMADRWRDVLGRG